VSRASVARVTTSPGRDTSVNTKPQPDRRYHIWTIGCQMNTADSQRLGSSLESLGYTWADEPLAADVIVLNTCVVRQQAEDKVLGRLGALGSWRKERPQAVLALMGCLVGHRPDRRLAERFPGVDVFLPPSEPGPLLDLLRARSLDGEARALADAERSRRWLAQDSGGELTLPSHERGRVIGAFVPIVYGCNWVCTFCIIPSRRGAERSRPQAEIVRHVQSLVQQGVREVTLLGQIVDRYGHDRQEPDALARLLRRLDGIEGLERIRFLTSHPSFLTEDLIQTVAELPKVMEQIEVPVQAGDDEVLARMKRGYRVDDYRRLVERIRSRLPHAAIHTDVIVGFPGETDRQFRATYDLMAELRFAKAHIARFSSRPGTVAALRMLDDVPEEEKERRRAALDQLQQDVCAAANAALAGQTVEVLVEGRHRDRWRSRTRTNKLVFFDDPRPLLGRVVDVRVSWAGPWSLIGRAADVDGP